MWNYLEMYTHVGTSVAGLVLNLVKVVISSEEVSYWWGVVSLGDTTQTLTQ